MDTDSQREKKDYLRKFLTSSLPVEENGDSLIENSKPQQSSLVTM